MESETNKRQRTDNISLKPDSIAWLCFEAYRALPKSGKPANLDKEFTVLAAIVECFKQTEHRVVCLATGTKCFPGNVPYRHEDIVDCHAESLLKRAFKRYILKLAENSNDSDEFYDNVFKHRTFTLFVSQAPCGSFSRWKGDDDDNHPDSEKFSRNFKCTGVNRKPGRGELCPKSGCIHKLAKWRLFGLQGSRLLSITRKPITFNRLIIGNCDNYPVIGMIPIIEQRLNIDPDEFDRLKNQEESCEIFSQQPPPPIQLEIAKDFRPEEFLRFKTDNDEKNPCGSSIVAWYDDQEHHPRRWTMKTEILAGGRRLGSGKRKSTNAKRSSTGVSIISDYSLNQEVDSIVKRFQSRSMLQLYQRIWDAAKRSISIYQGWPSISENDEKIDNSV